MKINSLIYAVVLIASVIIFYVSVFGFPHSLIINGGDENQRTVIKEAMQKVDKNVANSIYSVTISNDKTEEMCSGEIRGIFFGCTVTSFQTNWLGNRVKADIYLANDKYNGCYTFNNTLYHEIGHVAYYYYYGQTQDSQVLFGTEQWVNDFANKYAPTDC